MNEDQELIIQRYPEMYWWLTALLGRHDIMGITESPDDARDEYSTEAATIIPGLLDLMDEVDRRHPLRWSDIRDVIHNEFTRWFGGDAGIKPQYEAMAHEIYEILKPVDKGEEIPPEAYVAATKWREH